MLFLAPTVLMKSAKMRMISGLIIPDPGIITVVGMNITERNVETKQRPGYVHQ
ncbi:MAG: hypothetical protein ACLFUR_04700 [Candidatus Hadarchaeia archaeon]